MLCLGLYEISFNEFIIVIISITIIHFFINHLFKKDWVSRQPNVYNSSGLNLFLFDSPPLFFHKLLHYI